MATTNAAGITRPKRFLELRYPLAGVTRRGAFQDANVTQAVYGTPWAVNCRSRDPLARRLRGGSRPAITAGGAAVPVPPVTVVNNTVSVRSPGTGESVEITPTTGTLPPTATFGVLYYGRLVLADGRVISASRLGDYRDWNYGADAEDEGAATFWQLSEADELGTTATALIPYQDRFLVQATAGSIWVLTGNPTSGSLRNVTRRVGIVGRSAYVLVDSTIYFLAADGLWTMGVDGGNLQSLSQEHVPEELRGLSGDGVVLAYSPDERGIYVFIQGVGLQWFYDLEASAFWPMTLSNVPTAAYLVDGALRLDCNGSAYQVGGSGGFTSHVLVGPIRTASPGFNGQILSIQGSLSEGSGSVTWRLIPGATAEEACENGKRAINGEVGHTVQSGTFSAGRSPFAYPRSRAPWFVIWLSASTPWAFESLLLEIAPAGRWR